MNIDFVYGGGGKEIYIMKEIKIRTKNRVSGKIKIKNYSSVRDLAKAYNIPYMTLYMRLFQGWAPETACATPVRARKKPKPKVGRLKVKPVVEACG
jgi:hypothetical protein